MNNYFQYLNADAHINKNRSDWNANCQNTSNNMNWELNWKFALELESDLDWVATLWEYDLDWETTLQVELKKDCETALHLELKMDCETLDQELAVN